MTVNEQFTIDEVVTALTALKYEKELMERKMKKTVNSDEQVSVGAEERKIFYKHQTQLLLPGNIDLLSMIASNNTTFSRDIPEDVKRFYRDHHQYLDFNNYVAMHVSSTIHCRRAVCEKHRRPAFNVILLPTDWFYYLFSDVRELRKHLENNQNIVLKEWRKRNGGNSNKGLRVPIERTIEVNFKHFMKRERYPERPISLNLTISSTLATNKKQLENYARIDETELIVQMKYFCAYFETEFGCKTEGLHLRLTDFIQLLNNDKLIELLKDIKEDDLVTSRTRYIYLKNLGTKRISQQQQFLDIVSLDENGHPRDLDDESEESEGLSDEIDEVDEFDVDAYKHE